MCKIEINKLTPAMSTEIQEHWEHVYEHKTPKEVSWTQDKPTTSLRYIFSCAADKSASIIDVGGGDSKLVDYLLEEGYKNITVLDISSAAIERAKIRLGNKAQLVNWVVSDITAYQPDRKFDVWHDRAAFHFLTNTEQISNYIDILAKSTTGYLVMATFSDKGPTKCSGLDIKQYSILDLQKQFEKLFQQIECLNEDHTTPFDTKQNFTFCKFKKR
jgi:2-polyprenyl-3-methyl-5-hydroxy-6-metoxy-1,4-benzoquinol methylase